VQAKGLRVWFSLRSIVIWDDSGNLPERALERVTLTTPRAWRRRQHQRSGAPENCRRWPAPPDHQVTVPGVVLRLGDRTLSLSHAHALEAQAASAVLAFALHLAFLDGNCIRALAAALAVLVAAVPRKLRTQAVTATVVAVARVMVTSRLGPP
jgi:hypothetical protein